ncbi:MAG: hypothetical protein U9R79_12625 [Armatimonadota bacterium]|nr:hypothetical protein [Armatimonadota bacterium]
MPEAAAPEILGISTEVIGVWIAAFLTLAIFSFLYRDNPVYKLAEHVFVGISAGYGVVITYREAVLPLLIDPLFHPDKVNLEGPNYVVIIPGLLGLLMFSRFFPRYDWLSRWPIAFVMGLYSGLNIPYTIYGYMLPQFHATLLPVWPSKSVHMPPALLWWAVAGGIIVASGITLLAITFVRDRALDLWGLALIGGGLLVGSVPLLMVPHVWIAFSNFLLIVGVLCTLAYFYFSREHAGTLGVASTVGIFFLMVAFGAGFGQTVMARISLLIGRVQFLYHDWWLPHVWEHLSRLVG